MRTATATTEELNKLQRKMDRFKQISVNLITKKI